ncbi:MAG: hypothetical protein RIM84_12095 [Alphaproteobacteria bacterium]
MKEFASVIETHGTGAETHIIDRIREAGDAGDRAGYRRWRRALQALELLRADDDAAGG